MKSAKCRQVALFILAAIVVVAGTTGSAQACSQHATQATAEARPADCTPHCHGSSGVIAPTSTSTELGPPSAETAESNLLGWRYVTHYGCGGTALYLVDLCRNNLLLCPYCYRNFWAFVC